MKWSKAMTKTKIALLLRADGRALLCGIPAKAQYTAPPPPMTARAMMIATETVIVHPDYGFVEKRQLVGHINGEVNPVELSISAR